MPANLWIVGLDIGGTLTDVFMAETVGGRSVRFKSLTDARDPAAGAIVALDGARTAPVNPRHKLP